MANSFFQKLSFMSFNLHELLGVAPTATAEELRAAYRRRLLQVHPDKGGSVQLCQLLVAAFSAKRRPSVAQTDDQAAAAVNRDERRRRNVSERKPGKETEWAKRHNQARLMARIVSKLRRLDKEHRRRFLALGLSEAQRQQLESFMQKSRIPRVAIPEVPEKVRIFTSGTKRREQRWKASKAQEPCPRRRRLSPAGVRWQLLRLQALVGRWRELGEAAERRATAVAARQRDAAMRPLEQKRRRQEKQDAERRLQTLRKERLRWMRRRDLTMEEILRGWSPAANCP